jgi:predicted DNA-binding protein
LANKRATKPVHSLRLSPEGLRQLKDLSEQLGRSESIVVEVALDRMYREEMRFGRLSIHEPEGIYPIAGLKEDK